MKEKKFEADALMRVVVVAVGFGLVVLVAMWWLSYKWMVKFDIIIPWAAFCSVIGGVSSWIYTNLTRAYSDSARLSDARKDKLADLAAEIIEKTHQLHRAVKLIANDFFSAGEIEQAREKYGIQEEDKHYEEGIVFSYRYDQMKEAFTQYRRLDIKARIYFGDEVEKVMQEFKSIISSVLTDIYSINDLYDHDEDVNHIYEIKKSICILSAENISPGRRVNEEAAKRFEKFKDIPGRTEKALLKYVRGD